VPVRVVVSKRVHFSRVRPPMTKFTITTDTSTIAVFDLEALKHRIDDDCDWWTYEGFPELQEELTNQTLVLINTGFDGTFTVEVEKTNVHNNYVPLNCPSGCLYVVCGEEIPGEGIGPKLTRGGGIVEVGSSRVSIGHSQNDSDISIGIIC